MKKSSMNTNYVGFLEKVFSEHKLLTKLNGEHN